MDRRAARDDVRLMARRRLRLRACHSIVTTSDWVGSLG